MLRPLVLIGPVVEADEDPSRETAAAWRRFRRARLRSWVLGTVLTLVAVPVGMLGEDMIPDSAMHALLAQGREKVWRSEEGKFEAFRAWVAVRWLKGWPAKWQREIRQSWAARLRGEGAIASGVIEVHRDELLWFPSKSGRGLGAHEMLLPLRTIDHTVRRRLGRQHVGLTIYLRDGGELWLYVRCKP